MKSLGEAENFGKEPVQEFQAKDEMGKELLIVVRRGHRADLSDMGIVQRNDLSDLRVWSDEMSWKEIKRDCIDHGRGSSSEDDDTSGNEDNGDEVDVPHNDMYDDPDGYEFPGFLRVRICED